MTTKRDERAMDAGDVKGQVREGPSTRAAGELPLFGTLPSMSPTTLRVGETLAPSPSMMLAHPKLSTGVRRLNEVLGGGVPDRSFTLLYGPPFLGKEVLARRFFLEGLAERQPGIFVLTTQGVDEVRAELAEMDPAFPGYEAAGLAYFVDAYSKPLGVHEGGPTTRFVDGLTNLSALASAIQEVEKEVNATHASHRLVFDSISTLEAYAGEKQTFPFVQMLIGRSRRAGATGLLLLDEGMHAPAEVHALKHLANGMIECARENDKSLLHLEGIGLNESLAWIEYRYSAHDFELTGTTAGGRIR